jgi:hypothetical protein
LKQGIPDKTVNNLHLLGISGIANMLSAAKFAKYYELTERDVVFTVLTDSMELYESRLKELRDERGEYSKEDAVRDFHRYLMAVAIDNMLELDYYDRKRIHNLKYFTWVEQQGRDVDELNAQWYDYPDYWREIQSKADKIDQLIEEFNESTGLLREL